MTRTAFFGATVLFGLLACSSSDPWLIATLPAGDVHGAAASQDGAPASGDESASHGVPPAGQPDPTVTAGVDAGVAPPIDEIPDAARMPGDAGAPPVVVSHSGAGEGEASAPATTPTTSPPPAATGRDGGASARTNADGAGKPNGNSAPHDQGQHKGQDHGNAQESSDDAG